MIVYRLLKILSWQPWDNRKLVSPRIYDSYDFDQLNQRIKSWDNFYQTMLNFKGRISFIQGRNMTLSPITIQTQSGLNVTFRPIAPGDRLSLGTYFLSLSDFTKSMYGPHDFDQDTADKLCSEHDNGKSIRLIATIPELETKFGFDAGSEKVIAYFILQLGVPDDEIARYRELGISLDPQGDCLIAPSVADDFQNQGIGSPLMNAAFDFARQLGRRYMLLMGGVYQDNERAVHYYRKMGFREAGSFVTPWSPDRLSYDMYRVL